MYVCCEEVVGIRRFQSASVVNACSAGGDRKHCVAVVYVCVCCSLLDRYMRLQDQQNQSLRDREADAKRFAARILDLEAGPPPSSPALHVLFVWVWMFMCVCLTCCRICCQRARPPTPTRSAG